ncbi:MAG: heme ABC exporter ATP-binding protein CcmA [Dehalococcoidia bacterium]|nr:heme ABC exporter ATP-binding protein CcmA [Dehalococcoidia bacterium]
MEAAETEMPVKGKAVVIQGLYVSFGSVPALKGIDLELERGERVMVLGPNGAGKTTLLRTLACLIRPRRGKCSVEGFSISQDSNQVRACVGLVGHQPLLYSQLTVEENLSFYGRLYLVDGLGERISEVLDMVGMDRKRKEMVGTLSYGQQRRIAIARALLHRPPLLLLDEPDSGLDAEGFSILKEIVTQEGHTVLLTTHNVERNAPLVHRSVLLVNGRLVEGDRSSGVETYAHTPLPSMLDAEVS